MLVAEPLLMALLSALRKPELVLPPHSLVTVWAAEQEPSPFSFVVEGGG
jgi:hypothetical protein